MPVTEERIIFTKKMKEEYTILIPMMAPIHFKLLQNIFLNNGFHVELLENSGPNVVQEGLKYVHNDTCYPALLVIGQMIDALHSGKYDLHKVALIITQTGGGCRASNYIHLLRKSLKNAGLSHIPVISLNVAGLEKNPGFVLTLRMIRQMLAAVIYGDMLMLLSNQTRPYETQPGASDALIEDYIKVLSRRFRTGKAYSLREMGEVLERIAADFSALPVMRTPKTKVGVVGEIYVKYSSVGNNNLEDFLASKDCEIMVPGILGFLSYCVQNQMEDHRLYGGGWIASKGARIGISYLEKIEKLMIDTVKRHPPFLAPSTSAHVLALAKQAVGSGCKMGEGWLLTGEMLELVEQGFVNIVCTQPFGCLPNHIVGKGMIRKLQRIDPRANIVAIDYDPGATKVNQENRIELMLAMARERERAEAGGSAAG